jgi:hypothetical protein
MLSDALADLRAGGGRWKDRLWSWVVHDGEGLARCDRVIHGRRHYDSEVPMGTPTSVGWDSSRILFEFVAKTSKGVVGGLSCYFPGLEGEAFNEIFG